MQVFFVLSGFLITWLLLEELRRTGSIDLRRFYFRRTFRILPPAYAYLLIIWFASRGFAAFPVSSRSFMESFLFIRNLSYLTARDVTGHYWSLSIEEQFYLLWPLLLFLVPARWRIACAATLACASPVWQSVEARRFGNYGARFDLECGALIIGCLLGLMRSDADWKSRLDRESLRGTWFLLTCALTAFVLYNHHLHVSNALQHFAACVLIALFINGLLAGGPRIILAPLNFAPIAWLGRLSFSLYLWQQCFCISEKNYWPCRLPQSPLIALGAAIASFYLIERPALRLREWLRPHAAQVAPGQAASGSPISH